ncbi:hypothetical protein BGZ60DRAFT_519913 [Tricladium varicosporioides]|nr:hypothetical protein BGZ60DRAFT_519913 [Hymenoscyphus varicosporioides]
MNHIKLPFYCDQLPLVPLLCAEKLNCLTGDVAFSEYPASLNIDVSLFRKAAFHQLGKTPEVLSAFIQEWLFFYFLEKTIGTVVKIEWSDFQIIDDKTKAFVSTDKLSTYLKRCEDAFSLNKKIRRNIKECLDSASLYTTSLMDENGEQCPGLCLPQEVILSIMVLHQTFYKMVYGRVSLKNAGFTMYAARRNNVGIVIPAWLRDRLFRAGYCRYDIANFAETEDVLTILYLSLQHSHRKIKSDHGACSKEICYVMQIDENNYFTKHDRRWCDSQSICPRISIVVAKVKDILDKGEIPVAQIEEDFTLRVMDSEQAPYVAISHVWADGLGDTSGNSLPKCQIKRIRNLLTKFSGIAEYSRGNMYPTRLVDKLDRQHSLPCFWIDTLCVPRPTTDVSQKDKEDLEHYRQLAIMRMNDTYALAGAVLVLDEELLSIPHDASLEYVMPQLLQCGWMKRLWTYLEASLAIKRLYVQLDGGALLIWRCLDELSCRSHATSLLSWEIAIKVVKDFKDLVMYNISFKEHDISRRLGCNILVQYLHDTRRRTATRAGDRYICFAIVLGLSRGQIRQVLQTPEGNRWRVLVQNLNSLPRNIIFSPGVKCLEDGYRWMCVNFFETIFDRSLLDNGDGRSEPTQSSYSATLDPHKDGLKMRACFAIFPPQDSLFYCIYNSNSWVFPVVGSFPPFHAGWFKMDVDSHAKRSIESLRKAFGKDYWWRKRPFAVLLPEVYHPSGPIVGALVSISKEVTASVDEDLSISDLISDETVGYYYDSDASGIFAEQSIDTHECRYISRVILESTEEGKWRSSEAPKTCLVTQDEPFWLIL